MRLEPVVWAIDTIISGDAVSVGLTNGELAPVIVPRWEWRTFGDSFGDAEDRLRAGDATGVKESDEVYVLSVESDSSVKVRGGQMDVKRLEAVSEVGLEQWRPVLKAEFPLAAADVGAVLDALAVARPLVRDAYTLDELLEEIVRADPALHAIDVHKRREHFTFAGCMAELSELRTDAGSRRTIAIESEDPARLVAAVAELGLEARANVNVPRALKALAGIGSRCYAVIDIGTNSVKFLVGARRADGEWETVTDRAEVTRLGEGLDETGRIEDEPLARTVAAIVEMADEARRDGVVAIAAVGTAGLRLATNRDEFVAAVREGTGVEVEVIPGEEEGRLAYAAATSGLGGALGPLVVFDTGGGSSQFTFGRDERVDERFSVNVGAARFTERFGLDRAVDDATLSAAREAIAADLSRLDGRQQPDTLVGMGGANTNLVAVKLQLASYDANAVHGTVLDAAEIERQIELYRTSDAEQRRSIVGLQPNRAEVILAGACIVRTVLAKLGRDSVTVSDRGLRHALIVERFTD
jgi:exopolyphosphatase/guanosine-5'-triphosphate,3'-diphosphate pyrophosphatase